MKIYLDDKIKVNNKCTKNDKRKMIANKLKLSLFAKSMFKAIAKKKKKKKIYKEKEKENEKKIKLIL